jgi:NADH-quinone oxidoreductase subunit G
VPTVRANAATLARLGLDCGDSVVVKAGEGIAKLKAELDATAANGCVRVAAAHATTVALGSMFGSLTVEKA